MSILGISGSSSTLYQYLQSLSSATKARTPVPQMVRATDSDGNSLVSGSTQSTTTTPISQETSSINTGSRSLVQQLETAIQDAVHGVNASQSNNPQAVLSAIEQAIQTTLQGNGINPSQHSQTGHHRHGYHGGSAGNVFATQGTNGASSYTSSVTSESRNLVAISRTPGLDWLLSELNIDPQQFRYDVISAFSGSQNGNLDQSQIFQSFPTGQNVNVLP